MILPRTTVCNKIEIKMPRWKQRVVGIAAYRVGTHNAIDIMAKGKDGKRYFPDTLYASGDLIRSGEQQVLSQGTTLYLVPISKLEPLERSKPLGWIELTGDEIPQNIREIFWNDGEKINQLILEDA